MADNLPDTIENQLLDALVGSAVYSVTTPIKCRLMTANGNDSTPGTEVVGGTYASQTITFDPASGGVIGNNSVLNFTGMPAVTTVGVELWDSAGSPKRLAYGALSANKTTAAGDTLQFGVNQITISLQ